MLNQKPTTPAPKSINSHDNSASAIDKFKLHSVDELAAFPPAEWLIEGIIDAKALAVLFGPPRSAKSFTALDWSLCIATKTPWQGHDVKKKGRVVYVLGEGSRGIWKRVRAWMQHHGFEKVSRALFVIQAPRMLEASDVSALMARIKGDVKDPALVVIDTLATAFVGGDENSSKEMGQFVEACRRLQSDLNTTVLIVHHSTKKDPENERGSSLLRGGADAMILQRMTETRQVTIKNTKQKDDEEFENITLELRKRAIGVTSEGKPLTSCVLVMSSAGDGVGNLNDKEVLALKALAMQPDGQAHSAIWREAISADTKTKTFDNWRKKLVQLGLVESVLLKKHHYRITSAGSATANGTQKATPDKVLTVSATATPL